MQNEPDYGALDPGIREAVRALISAGFETCDSGDGKYKAELGWPDEEWSDVPHVVIRVEPGELETTGMRLGEWVLANNLKEVDVTAHLYTEEGNPLNGLASWSWVLFLAGEELYNFSSTTDA